MDHYHGEHDGPEQLGEVRPCIEASPEILREAFNAQTERWNELIWSLSKLAKDGAPYEGETDEELLTLLRKRLDRGNAQ